MTQAQQDEYDARLAADLEWITKTFIRARQTGAYGVVLLMQADMWDPAAIGGDGLWGFDPIVERIGKLSAKFGRPVLMLEGDSHVCRVDHPYTASDPLYYT